MDLLDKINRIGNKKVFILLVFVTLLIGSIILFIHDQSNKTVNLGEESFTYKSKSNGVWQFKDSSENELIAYSLFSEGERFNMTGELVVEYKGNLYKRVFDNESGNFLIYEGERLIGEYPVYDLIIEAGEVQIGDHIIEYERALFNKVQSIIDYVNSGSTVAILFLMLFLSILGASTIVYPIIFWHLRHFLNVQGGEPTEFYLVTTQISGVLLLIFSIFIPIVSLK